MGRISAEIRRLRGERLRELLKDHGMSQAKLADELWDKLKIKVSPQFVNDMVHGRKTLTETTAQDVMKIFPEYRIQWLLGYDDFKTEAEYRESFLQELSDIKSKSDMVFEWLLFINGWTMYCLPTNDSAHSVCYFKNKDGSSFILDDLDMYAFRGEILDYVGLRMKSMSETYQRKKSEESR